MNKFRFIGPFIAGIIVGQLGISYGTQQCKDDIEQLLSNVFTISVAKHMSVQVKALEKFRMGDTSGGIELLETFIDIDLATLADLKPTIAIDNTGEILRNLKAAKDYRNKYPMHVVNETRVESVTKALELAK